MDNTNDISNKLKLKELEIKVDLLDVKQLVMFQATVVEAMEEVKNELKSINKEHSMFREKIQREVLKVDKDLSNLTTKVTVVLGAVTVIIQLAFKYVF